MVLELVFQDVPGDGTKTVAVPEGCPRVTVTRDGAGVAVNFDESPAPAADKESEQPAPAEPAPAASHRATRATRATE